MKTRIGPGNLCQRSIFIRSRDTARSASLMIFVISNIASQPASF